MKINNININTLFFLALSTVMINGCVVKNEPNRTMHNFAKSQTKKVSWNHISRGDKKDCIDCYATPVGNKRVVRNNERITYDYSNTPRDTFNNSIDYSKPPSESNNAFMKSTKVVSNNKTIDTLHYDAYDYTMSSNDTDIKNKSYPNLYVTPQVSPVYSSRGNYSTSNTAIQIGAFRKYAGAKVYAKKYNALSSKYNVTIKTGVKNNQPLHRVRIEGFANRVEAKNFMARYGITEGFLVRK